MGLISLEYIEVLLRAGQLESAARQCDNADAAVNKILAASGDFAGEYYQAFYTKVQEWARENRRIATELRSTATLIKKVAEEIKDADESVASAFR